MEDENSDGSVAVEEPPAEVPAEAQPEAPASEAPGEESAPAEAPPAEEPKSEEAPAPVEAPAAPAEQKSPLDLLFDRIDARLAGLEGVAHRDHSFSLDQSAVEEIAGRVMALIGESVRKHLG